MSPGKIVVASVPLFSDWSLYLFRLLLILIFCMLTNFLQTALESLLRSARESAAWVLLPGPVHERSPAAPYVARVIRFELAGVLRPHDVRKLLQVTQGKGCLDTSERRVDALSSGKRSQTAFSLTIKHIASSGFHGDFPQSGHVCCGRVALAKSPATGCFESAFSLCRYRW